jgi:hypothetical protein
MHVSAWLRDLGLEQQDVFHANDIDGGVLLELTAEDLVSLGVASVGHRRKLLAAIAALRAGSSPVKIPSNEAPATVARRRSRTCGAGRPRRADDPAALRPEKLETVRRKPGRAD